MNSEIKRYFGPLWPCIPVTILQYIYNLIPRHKAGNRHLLGYVPGRELERELGWVVEMKLDIIPLLNSNYLQQSLWELLSICNL